MLDRRALLDTNILVFAYLRDHKWKVPAEALVRELFDTQSSYTVAEQNLLEWYSVITSPKRLSDQLTPDTLPI